MKSNPSRLTVIILLWAVSLSLSAVVQSDADTEKQLLSPETEMAIMRVMNLENRIQTLQTVPVKVTDNELAGHFSGTWICSRPGGAFPVFGWRRCKPSAGHYA